MSLDFDGCDWLKVDVDECRDIARTQGVRVMPTFKIYKGRDCLETFEGFNKATIVKKLVDLGAPKSQPPPEQEVTADQPQISPPS